MNKTSGTTPNNESDKSSKPVLSDKGIRRKNGEHQAETSSAATAGDRQQASSTARPVALPVIPVAQFCREYNLSDNIRDHLEKGDPKLQTAGALLEVSETTLQQAGFKSGQIADLKRALKEFLVANITSEPAKDNR
ncbi:hypothetical protein K438DRAFT_1777908 [Mycena galopus ATCC 62051]|nr:hypothetical protein K438DRAFT_1777908 [Mycena galopus ATCC 62051]